MGDETVKQDANTQYAGQFVFSLAGAADGRVAAVM